MAWSCSSQCLSEEWERVGSARSPAIVRAGAGKIDKQSSKKTGVKQSWGGGGLQGCTHRRRAVASRRSPWPWEGGEQKGDDMSGAVGRAPAWSWCPGQMAEGSSD